MLRRFTALLFLAVAWPLSAAETTGFYEPKTDYAINRSDIFLPMGSFLLPGLGQFVSGHFGYATLYSGVALGGLFYGIAASGDIDKQDSADASNLESKNIPIRKQILGLQTYQSMGGFSLFHTFETAASLRQKEGSYQFLKLQERPQDLALAPFQFKYLANARTWIPLTLVAAVGWYSAAHPQDGWQKDAFRSEDAAFVGGFAWNAGTHEEAAFRGWLMPVMREYWMNDTWSNVSQASLFAAAHLSSTPVPLTQFLLGLHLGNVAINNGWSLGESIFIHTWWDVIVFTSMYHSKPEDRKKSGPARINLPPVQWAF